MADFPLLNEASLVMIPGATKEGKVYSQVPTDGSGDFTFTRSTSATRVNEAGNIEKGYENILLQSNTFSDAAWTTNNASITGGQSGYDSSNDAWLISKTGSSGRIQQSISTSNLNAFSVYAKKADSDYIFLQMLGGVNPNARFSLITGDKISSFGIVAAFSEPIGNGWFRFTLVGDNSLSLVRVYPSEESSNSATTGSIYIQDAMLNQGLVAYPYLETTTAPVYGGLQSDQPRLDYTDATCPSLLLEPSRTNLINHSEYFEGWHTDANVSYIANSTISPEGLINAAKLTATNTSNAYVRDNINGSAGNNVFSVFAKYEDCQYIYLSTRFFNGGDEARVWFDIQNGVKGSSTGDDATYDIEDYGNGWYRCYVIFNIDAGDTNGYSYIYLSNTDGSSNVTSGTSAHLYGGQFEVGSYPTSYIPTYGSAESRGEDVCVDAGDINTFNSTEGVLYFEGERLSLLGNKRTISISDGSLNNYLYIQFQGVSNTIRIFYKTIEFGQVLLLNHNLSNELGLNKYAFRWSNNNFSLWINGTKELEQLNGSTATSNVLSELNFDVGNGFDKFYGDVKQVLVFPTALTDSECIELTTI